MWCYATMKIFLALFITYFSFSIVFGYDGFHCVPSMRDSRFQALVQGEDIIVLVTNPMGYEFMPQFEGPFSIFNISFNKMQGEDLKDLGATFTFTWPKESCKLDSANFVLNCRSQAKNKIGTVKSFGVTTTEVIEKYDDEIYEKRKFRFAFEKDNIYFVALQFNKKSCEKFN